MSANDEPVTTGADPAEDATETEHLRTERKRYTVSIWATILLAAPIILAIHLLEHVYGSGTYNNLPVFRGVTVAQTAEWLAITKILIDGASKAALVTLAVSVIVQIDVFKVYDKIITIVKDKTLQAAEEPSAETISGLRQDLATLTAALNSPTRVEVPTPTQEWLSNLAATALHAELNQTRQENDQLKAQIAEILSLQERANAELQRITAIAQNQGAYLTEAREVFDKLVELASRVAKMRDQPPES